MRRRTSIQRFSDAGVSQRLKLQNHRCKISHFILPGREKLKSSFCRDVYATEAITFQPTCLIKYNPSHRSESRNAIWRADVQCSVSWGKRCFGLLHVFAKSSEIPFFMKNKTQRLYPRNWQSIRIAILPKASRSRNAATFIHSETPRVLCLPVRPAKAGPERAPRAWSLIMKSNLRLPPETGERWPDDR